MPARSGRKSRSRRNRKSRRSNTRSKTRRRGLTVTPIHSIDQLLVALRKKTTAFPGSFWPNDGTYISLVVGVSGKSYAHSYSLSSVHINNLADAKYTTKNVRQKGKRVSALKGSKDEDIEKDGLVVELNQIPGGQHGKYYSNFPTADLVLLRDGSVYIVETQPHFMSDYGGLITHTISTSRAKIGLVSNKTN